VGIGKRGIVIIKIAANSNIADSIVIIVSKPSSISIKVVHDINTRRLLIGVIITYIITKVGIKLIADYSM